MSDDWNDYCECAEPAPLPATPPCMRERGHIGDHQSCDEDSVLSTWPREGSQRKGNE